MNDLYHHLSLFLKELKKTGEKPLLVVCGPTASGKSALSMQLAQDFNGEIVSADSSQVYRKMDVGTAKPSFEERQRVKHHLVDIRDPDQDFNVSDFKKEATWAINDILKRGKLPILCGGTGLYLSAIVDNYELADAPPDPVIRQELQEEYEKGGKDQLYKMLVELDPARAAKIHPNNVRYVARALEIVLQTKKPMEDRKAKPQYNVFKIGIDWDRDELYEHINQRVDQMVAMGLVDELKTLLAKGYPEEAPGFKALGYKEFFPFLKGEKPLEDCLADLKQATRNYAKRQLTWFRKEEDIYWVPRRDLSTSIFTGAAQN